MSENNSRSSLSDSEIYTLLLLSPIAVPIVLALVPGWWDRALNWLVGHHILVAASEAPMVMFPGDVAGVDARRLVVAVAVCVVVMVCAGSWVRVRRARRIDRLLNSGDRA